MDLGPCPGPGWPVLCGSDTGGLLRFGDYPYTWLVLVSIVVFFAMRLAVGYWASRQVTDAADYIVAGRRLPIYIAAASIMATWFAAETLMGAASTAYKYGFQGVIFDPFGAVLCLLISGLFFIRLMRRARYLTVVDFFEKRYGREMSLLASAGPTGDVLRLDRGPVRRGRPRAARTAGLAAAGGHPVRGPDRHALYHDGRDAGRHAAGLHPDVLHRRRHHRGVLCTCLQAVGGWSGMVSDAASRPSPSRSPCCRSPAKGSWATPATLGCLYWLAAWMSLGLGSIACQDLMQRSMSAKNEATSVWGTYLAAVLYFVFGIMSPLIGIMMFKLHPQLPEANWTAC